MNGITEFVSDALDVYAIRTRAVRVWGVLCSDPSNEDLQRQAVHAIQTYQKAVGVDYYTAHHNVTQMWAMGGVR